MKYPRYNRYLIFEKTIENFCDIKNCFTEEEWKTEARYAYFLKALDGHTDPYKINPDLSEETVERLLVELNQKGLLEKGERIMPLGFGSILISLWTPKIGKIHRLLGIIWNHMLIVTWLPLLVAGICVLMSGSWDYVDRGYGTLTGYLLGIGMGLFLHELSHAAACIGYGGHFFEMGVMTHLFLPGAYVFIDYDDIKNRYKRAQINAAGIECNFVLAGIFLCALKWEIFDSFALILAAALNVVLAIFNTTLIAGIDGIRIFQDIFGCEDFLVKALDLIFNERGKRLLRKRGVNGRATIAACYMIVFLQVLLPIVLLMNIISIATMFL